MEEKLNDLESLKCGMICKESTQSLVWSRTTGVKRGEEEGGEVWKDMVHGKKRFKRIECKKVAIPEHEKKESSASNEKGIKTHQACGESAKPNFHGEVQICEPRHLVRDCSIRSSPKHRREYRSNQSYEIRAPAGAPPSTYPALCENGVRAG